MPTGYTAIIDDKEDVTFEEFAWRCARGMGALYHMRDDAMDAEPRPETPSTYHTKRLAELVIERDALHVMPSEDWDAVAEKEYEDGRASWEKSRAEETIVLARYREMEKRVSVWQPPTPEHTGFKSFMLEQLATGKPYALGAYKQKRLDGHTWYKAKLKKLEEEITYHLAEEAKDRERAKGRTAWIKALAEVLPAPQRSR